MKRDIRDLAIRSAAVVALLVVACTEGDRGDNSPPPALPEASATVTAGAKPSSEGPATPPPVPACRDLDLPPPGPGESQDSWARARAALPAEIGVYRPRSVPERFGESSLLEACVDPQTGPRYTVAYRFDGESLVFILDRGFGAWGNVPGPPTSNGDLLVRGTTGTLTITSGGASSGPPQPANLELAWQQSGLIYRIRAISSTLTGADLVRIAEDLVPARSEAASATSVGRAELFVAQAIGLRGCEEPVYVRAGGLPPSTAVRLEGVNTPVRPFVGTTSPTGFFRLRLDDLAGVDCGPGRRLAFRIVDVASGSPLATAELWLPVLDGRIEIDPPNGGCTSITVTLRGFPANARVTLIAQAPDPMSHNGFSVIAEPPTTDANGFARVGPFPPPWLCDLPALGLFATTDGPGARRGELLYRIALGPNDPIPGLQ